MLKLNVNLVKILAKYYQTLIFVPCTKYCITVLKCKIFILQICFCGEIILYYLVLFNLIDETGETYTVSLVYFHGMKNDEAAKSRRWTGIGSSVDRVIAEHS